VESKTQLPTAPATTQNIFKPVGNVIDTQLRTNSNYCTVCLLLLILVVQQNIYGKSCTQLTLQIWNSPLQPLFARRFPFFPRQFLFAGPGCWQSASSSVSNGCTTCVDGYGNAMVRWRHPQNCARCRSTPLLSTMEQWSKCLHVSYSCRLGGNVATTGYFLLLSMRIYANVNLSARRYTDKTFTHSVICLQIQLLFSKLNRAVSCTLLGCLQTQQHFVRSRPISHQCCGVLLDQSSVAT